MTRWSVWVAGQDLAQNRCALTVGAAGRTGGILGTELVRTLWAPSLPLGGDMRGGEGRGDRVTCTMVKVDWSYVRVCLS